MSLKFEHSRQHFHPAMPETIIYPSIVNLAFNFCDLVHWNLENWFSRPRDNFFYYSALFSSFSKPKVSTMWQFGLNSSCNTSCRIGCIFLKFGSNFSFKAFKSEDSFLSVAHPIYKLLRWMWPFWKTFFRSNFLVQCTVDSHSLHSGYFHVLIQWQTTFVSVSSFIHTLFFVCTASVLLLITSAMDEIFFFSAVKSSINYNTDPDIRGWGGWGHK